MYFDIFTFGKVYPLPFMSLKRKNSDQLDHSLRVIEELLLNQNQHFKTEELSQNEIEEIQAFIDDPDELNVFSLPGFIGKQLIQKEDQQVFWEGLIKLPKEDRKILFFTALGNEPALISEALNYEKPDTYWKNLDAAKLKLESYIGSIFDGKVIKSLYGSLEQILENYLLKSDEIDARKSKSNKGKTYKIAVLGGVGLLIIIYLFLRNFLFPPNTDLIFENKVVQIHKLSVESGDTTAILLESFDLIEDGYYSAALQLIEQGNTNDDEYNIGSKALEILLLLKEEQYYAARSLLKTYKELYPETFKSVFGGLIWKIRFL